MKKNIFLLLTLFLMAPSHGQDTITESSPCYMFWPHANPLVCYDTIEDSHNIVGTIFFETMATPGTMIYGVSLRGSNLRLDSSISVSLAERVRDTMYLYYDTAWLDSSVLYRHLSLRLMTHNGMIDYVDNCNEIYFHRPWPVPDTFYVVVRFGLEDPYNPRNERWLCLSSYEDSIWPQRMGYVYGEGVPSSYNPTPSPDFSGPINAAWGYEFPILEPNRRRCHKPTGVRPLERGDDWVVVGWDGGAGDSYRVTLEGPTDTLVLTTADTAVRLDSLLPDVLYWVEVQSLCRYQYGDYDSTFLNPGSTRLGVRVFGAGVTGTDGDPQVDIYPNPASDRIVLVTGGDTPVRATLMDLAGREITTVDFHTTTTLDVSLLPRGSYLLRLTTPAGTVTKKLLLQ